MHLSHIPRCSGFSKRSADLMHVKGIGKIESFFLCCIFLQMMPSSVKFYAKEAKNKLKTLGD